MDALETLAFAHAPVGLIYSEERIIRRCNPAFAEMFGYCVADLTDAPLSMLYPSQGEFERIGSLGAQKMLGTGSYADERIMRRSDGSHFWCRVRGRSLDPAVPFARAVWSFADLSNLRPATDLSMREREVAKMMTEGLTTKEIARDLGLSNRTVEVHRARLLAKMGAKNSVDLVARLAGLPLGV